MFQLAFQYLYHTIGKICGQELDLRSGFFFGAARFNPLLNLCVEMDSDYYPYRRRIRSFNLKKKKKKNQNACATF